MTTYLDNVQNALMGSLCLRHFPSEKVERHEKPEVEMKDLMPEKSGVQNFLCLNPVTIARGNKEKCLIEPSINSTRISFVFKHSDRMDSLICKKISNFFSRRADAFMILRKKPVEGYDLSFQITAEHLERFDKNLLIDFILEFLETMEADISEMKLNVNTQTRVAASYFVNCITGRIPLE